MYEKGRPSGIRVRYRLLFACHCYIPPLTQVGVVDASHKPVRETAAEKREREEIKVKGAAVNCKYGTAVVTPN